jgi:hypothetical protein
MEFRSLRTDAISWVQDAADNAMRTVLPTIAVRTLFVGAKVLSGASGRFIGTAGG